MKTSFLVNCVAAVFGIHACVSILEHIVEPPVVSNCSSVTLTCRVNTGAPNVEVWWTFRGENASKLPNTTIVTDKADKGEWKLELKCPKLEHNGTYVCNAQGRYEGEAVYSKEALLKISVPPKIAWVRILASTNAAILFEWRRQNHDKEADITHYAVQLHHQNGSLVADRNMAINAPGRNNYKYIFVGLKPGETYTFQVKACSALGCGNWSDPLEGKTLEGVPPKISWVRVLARTNETILFEWRRQNHDNGANITHYAVQLHYKNGSLVADRTMTINDPGRNSHMYMFLRLEPGKTYTFQVRACNALGCGNWSDPLEGTTLDGERTI